MPEFFLWHVKTYRNFYGLKERVRSFASSLKGSLHWAALELGLGQVVIAEWAWLKKKGFRGTAVLPNQELLGPRFFAPAEAKSKRGVWSSLWTVAGHPKGGWPAVVGFLVICRNVFCFGWSAEKATTFFFLLMKSHFFFGIPKARLHTYKNMSQDEEALCKEPHPSSVARYF